MSQAQFDIYRSKVMALARSMVIKCGPAAHAINSSLEAQGHSVNLADPASWKYYRNLNGEYHPADRVMSVTSLDTLQTIEFKKETLQDHRTTLRDYAFGSRYYNALVEQYPDQEMLIQGILNPVSPDVAIPATDGAILYHDRELVEENETNLIANLQLWTTRWWSRWYVAAYAYPDDLYTSVMFARLLMFIPSKIENLRLANCNTHYAHSFHIRQHLSSNGRLDRYVDYLTRHQMLWLYRNAVFLQRNSGKSEIFEELIENVMTRRAMPLGEWRMRHNTEEQADNIYPQVEFSRRQLNMRTNGIGSAVRSIPVMLDAERESARNNAVVQPEAESKIREQMENSIGNRLSTKILESALLDLSESTPYTLSDSLLNHWLHWAATGRYTSVITVDNPKTGGTITMDVKEAFIIYLYAFNLSLGIRLPNIPPLQAQMVRITPTPSRATLYSMVDESLVPHTIVDQIADQTHTLGNYISVPAFREAVEMVHAQKLKQRDIYSNVEHYLGRAQAEAVMQRLYYDVPVILEPEGTKYADWFREKGIDVPTYSELEADLLANQIATICVGANLKVVQSLRDIQSAMLGLMSHLSSYSVQFLQSINTSPIKVVDWPAIRPGDASRHLSHEDLLTHGVDGQSVSQYRRHRLFADFAEMGVNPSMNAFWNIADELSIDLAVTQEGHSGRNQVVGQNAPQILCVFSDRPSLTEDTPVRDTDNYLPYGKTSISRAFTGLVSPHYSLTQAERDIIRDRWNDYIGNEEFKTPISDLFPINRLGSLWPFIQGPVPSNLIADIFPSDTLGSLLPFIYGDREQIFTTFGPQRLGPLRPHVHDPEDTP